MRLRNQILRPAVAILLAGTLVAACGGGDDEPGETPTATVSQGDTPAAGRTPATSPTPGETGPSGMFTEPRVREPDSVVPAPQVPDSPFDPWDGEALIYDTLLGTTVHLGPGQLGSFSPDSRYYAWAEGEVGPQGGNGALKVLDLRGGQTLLIAEGRAPFFTDSAHVAFAQPSDPGTAVLADVTTGERSSLPYEQAREAYDAWSSALLTTTSDAFRIARRDPDSHFTVTNTGTGETVLQFEAFYAAPAGAGTIVVAATPVDGVSNLFLVPVDTGEAEFIGSARIAEFNFPLVANDDFVAWVDDFCGSPAGDLYIFDRAKGVLTAVQDPDGRWGFLRVTPGGLLGIGDFGAAVLLDPATLQYTTALPATGDIAWSPDYRFAALGWVGGHGGLC